MLALLLAGGCVTRGIVAVECRHEAGPPPHPDAGLVGLAGGLRASQEADQQAWDVKVDACVKQRREAKQ